MVLSSRILFLQAALIFAISVPQASGQQAGRIHGTITGRSTGEALAGVNVMLTGTTIGSATDLDGTFLLVRVPPGTYTLRVSAVGYATTVVKNIAVPPGASLEFNVSLAEEAYNLKEIVVTADEVRSTENAAISQRRRSSSISDGISAEQIHRSPDATSGDALRRMTGLSVVDNKFVIIRGITDRYNRTTIDGAAVTSTEAGKKSFSFDLLPANLLDNAFVIKSATPDLPGDFSGGLVQLNTLDFPAERTLKINLASSYNELTTSKDFLASRGGTRDWLGFDDGSRAYPGDQADANTVARNASNNWAPVPVKAPFNGSFSISAGDRVDFGEDNPGANRLGYVAALSYRNTYQRNENLIDDAVSSRRYSGASDDYSVLWGALANVSYKFGGVHTISFKNNFNRSALDEVTQYRGFDESIPLENAYTIIDWTQRSTYTGQVAGDHAFPALGGSVLQWRASVSSSRREDPDRKEVTYYRDPTDPAQPFTVAVNRRSWAHLNDRSTTLSSDLAVPAGAGRIKFGLFTQSGTTNYGVRYFTVTPDYFHGIPDSLTHLPLDVVYSPGNFGRGRFLFTESSIPTDSYEGDLKLSGGYLMMDVPFELLHGSFRAAGGARLENSEQHVFVPRTLQPDGPVNSARLQNADILPSVNFTYMVTNSANLRLAYSHSVNRPDYRELASTGFYDFVKYEQVAGNPDLQRSFVHNYDIRLEVFPGAGELFAVSRFLKVISGAIEEVLIPSATYERTWHNSSAATNSGWELEIRKSLKFLGRYFEGFSLSGNYTRVQSEVQLSRSTGNSSNTQMVLYARPLQGQSPYMINLSLLYAVPSSGTSVSLLYGKFGRRLDTVGFQAGDIYEEPRDLVDMAVAQQLAGALQMTLTIRNLNGKDRILTRDDRLYEETGTGRTYGLQISLGL